MAADKKAGKKKNAKAADAAKPELTLDYKFNDDRQNDTRGGRGRGDRDSGRGGRSDRGRGDGPRYARIFLLPLSLGTTLSLASCARLAGCY